MDLFTEWNVTELTYKDTVFSSSNSEIVIKGCNGMMFFQQIFIL